MLRFTPQVGAVASVGYQYMEDLSCYKMIDPLPGDGIHGSLELGA